MTYQRLIDGPEVDALDRRKSSFIYRNEPSRFPFLNSKGKDVIYSLNRAQKVSFFILVAVKKETSRNRMMPEASKRVAGG